MSLLFLLTVELSKLQQQEAEIKSKQVEVKHELEKWENLVKENQQKGKHWKKEVRRNTRARFHKDLGLVLRDFNSIQNWVNFHIKIQHQIKSQRLMAFG